MCSSDLARLSMHGYIKQALAEFQRDPPQRPRKGPPRFNPPKHGAKMQYATADESPPLGRSQVTFTQKVIGKLLLYARAVGATMLHATSDIALSATKGAEAALGATMHLLSYAASSPGAEAICRESGMALAAGSGAAYLAAPRARSRAGGCRYLRGESNKRHYMWVMALHSRLMGKWCPAESMRPDTD